MTAVWMGLTTMQKEIETQEIELIGDPNRPVHAAMVGTQPVREGEEPAWRVKATRAGLAAPECAQSGGPRAPPRAGCPRPAPSIDKPDPAFTYFSPKLLRENSRTFPLACHDDHAAIAFVPGSR